MISAQKRRQALILRTTFAFCAAFVLITATSYGRVHVSKIISEPARALSHKTSGLSIPPAYAQEEQCLNPAGVAVGLKGLQNIRPKNAFVGTIFERRGNECPCSFAQSECEINDPVYGQRECSSLVIDGQAAAANGYPDVTVKHTLKLCNYNDVNNDINIISPPSTVEFFYRIPDSGGKQVFLFDESYNEQVLNPGECREEVGSTTVSTRRAKYYMKSLLQGPQTKSGARKGYCYAYSFNKIDFKYDYGLGTCEVTTETSCFLTDDSGRSCEDYINSLDYVCTPFEAKFTGKACNDNNRAIQIQVNASNYKINSYKLKLDGTYKRDKTPLPREIVGGRCAVFSTTKMVDPCKPNFWSIGIQGSLYNVDAENGWVFKDKDCQTYLFSNLPIVDPESEPLTLEPNSSPTASPTLSSKPSVRPTSKPTLSTRPSSRPTTSPTVSSKPSGQPTASPTLTSKPSGQPTASPTLTSKPSGQPTASPTLTSKPSGQPTASPTLSSKPSVRPTSKPTLSTRPSSNPTASPSVSTKPSAAPTCGKGNGKGKSNKCKGKGKGYAP